MSVTLHFSLGQPAIFRRRRLIAPLLVAAAGVLPGPARPLRAETHSNLQAVTTVGTSAWGGSYPFTVTGVLLTDPDEMLDSTPNFQPASSNLMGGEWQVTVQAAEVGDRGGTTCWIGQNYALRRPPFDDAFSYSNEAWAAEVARLNHDPATGHAFQRGDLVAVTANRTLFYGGKRNINEAHDNDPSADFTISLVASNYGLPAPDVISLMSVMRTNDNNPATSEDIFDPTRLTGGEYWQGTRVRITGLTLVTTNGWNRTNLWNSRKCTVTDGENRSFTLRHPRYSLGPPPTNRFDAVGVFTQESGSGVQGTNGYELFVQQVLPTDDAVLAIAPGVVISWPGSLSNYRLLSAEALPAATWWPVTNLPALVDGRNSVTQAPGGGQKFYRLERVR
jgi:hypothetical protein